MNVTVPPGSVGELHLPKLFGAATLITESGASVWAAGVETADIPHVGSGAGLGSATGGKAGGAAVRVVADDGRFVIFATLCGQYTFEVSSILDH
jgi:hypothetical protein